MIYSNTSSRVWEKILKKYLYNTVLAWNQVA